MKKKILASAFSIFSAFCFSQSSELSNFTMVSVNYKFHQKFHLFAESQLRSIEDFSYPDYYEIKGGVGYYLTPNHIPFVGIGRYVSYKDHRLAKEEFRVWVQDIINLKSGKVKFENRFRAEKGWFYEPSGRKTDRVRLRYRLNVSMPIATQKIKQGDFFINGFSEVFFTFSENDPIFSRNRLYGGMGHKISKEMTVIMGYLWQKDFGLKSNKNTNFIYLGFNFNIDGTK